MTELEEYRIHKADYVASEEELALYVFFQDHPECDGCSGLIQKDYYHSFVIIQKVVRIRRKNEKFRKKRI